MPPQGTMAILKIWADLPTGEAVDGAGRNRYAVVCSRCDCKILRPGVGQWVDDRHDLPAPTLKARPSPDGAGEVQTESVAGYWKVRPLPPRASRP